MSSLSNEQEAIWRERKSGEFVLAKRLASLPYILAKRRIFCDVRRELATRRDLSLPGKLGCRGGQEPQDPEASPGEGGGGEGEAPWMSVWRVV